MVMENWSRDLTILCKKNWSSGIGRKKLGAIGEKWNEGVRLSKRGVRAAVPIIYTVPLMKVGTPPAR